MMPDADYMDRQPEIQWHMVRCATNLLLGRVYVMPQAAYVIYIFSVAF